MTSPEITAATQAQQAAARPDLSSWVTANAGSGKTSVLTNRVARVLLGGTPPARILCLTYTKAAAAEMQNRLFKQLGAWSMMPDEALIKALSALGVTRNTPEALADARRLFARALETPGGLKIQTIHAFCESLLRRFPLESGLSPAFQLLDDHAAAQLRDTVLDAMAEGPGRASLARLAGITRDFSNIIPAILRQQHLFDTPPDRTAIAAALGIAPDLDDEDILFAAMQGFSDADLDWLARQLAAGNATEKKAATSLDDMPLLPASQALDMFLTGLLTQKGKRPTRGLPGVDTKKIPGVDALLTRLLDAAETAAEARKATATLAHSEALHAFAHDFLAEYRAAKSRHQWLDFDDLIRHASALLHQSDMAAWVLYRLDGGIDHILIDEAQDTSPAQWRIFTKLVEEIVAGQGARDDQRSLFVVGDVKQSIFSFQGADPAGFIDIRADIAGRLAARDLPLQDVRMLHSFRSARPVLALVDAVFADATSRLGEGAQHISAFPDAPGRVDLWPFREAEAKPKPAPVFDLTPAPAPADIEGALALDIARHVAQMLADATPLPGANRPVRPGDFLILVRRRKEIYRALIRALKAEGVPIAGADRLRIADELAVRDLLAALRFAASPADDLSLATVLRSPLIGWDEAALFALAAQRKAGLWAALQAHGVPPMLQALRDAADFQRPYDLLMLILQDHGGRSALLARLGAECEEAVDELLNQALAFEAGAIPTLSAFLAWIDSGDVEVKRQVDEASDQLRIMTVHGAKGLEAPIVILPDTAHRPSRAEPHFEPLGQRAVGWTSRAEAAPADLLAARQGASARRQDEDLRLLYVAMTRAKTWLIVAGAGSFGPKEKGEEEPAKPCWYERIDAAFGQFAASAPDASGIRSILHNWDIGSSDETPAPAARPEPAALPDWLAPAPKPVRTGGPLSPSGLGGAHALQSEDGRDGAEARAYGNRVHAALEQLIALDDPAREAALQGLDDATARTEIAALLALPAMRDLLASAPLAEVGISATLPGLGAIFGRIDLLSITPERITAYDFKTNRALPASPSETPEALLRQMAAYRAALMQIYPGRQVDAALIWTVAPAIMPLDGKLMDAALERAIAAAAAP